MTNAEHTLKFATDDGDGDIAAGGLVPPGLRPLLSYETVRVIVRATGRLDEPTKAALMRAVNECEATPLGVRDREEAVDTLDRLCDELREPNPVAKRVRRFVNNLAAISAPAAAAIQGCESAHRLITV